MNMEKKRTIATDIAGLDDLDIEIKNELLEQRKDHTKSSIGNRILRRNLQMVYYQSKK